MPRSDDVMVYKRCFDFAICGASVGLNINRQWSGDVLVLIATVDGVAPPDAAFLKRIQEMFGRDSASAGFRALGMTADLILEAYCWLRTVDAIEFNVCARRGRSSG
jgi:hypothetical protein